MQTTKGPTRDSALGPRGEKAAARYLTAKNYAILHRNWSAPGVGEIDIVATDGQRVVFCEVKTRSGPGFGAPAEAVDDAKAERIRLAAAVWIGTYRIPFEEIRFDVIAVLWRPGKKPEIDHVEDAF